MSYILISGSAEVANIIIDEDNHNIVFETLPEAKKYVSEELEEDDITIVNIKS